MSQKKFALTVMGRANIKVKVKNGLVVRGVIAMVFCGTIMNAGIVVMCLTNKGRVSELVRSLTANEVSGKTSVGSSPIPSARSTKDFLRANN